MDDTSIFGPINTTAPNPVTNNQFVKALGSAMSRPTVLPVPSFVLKLLFGKDFASELLLTGTRVIPKKLEDHHFEFKYPTIDVALKQLIKGESASE